MNIASAEDIKSIYGTYDIPDVVIAGQTATFIYKFDNFWGYGEFLSIELVDTLPEGTQWVSGGTYDEAAHTVTIDNGPLPEEESATFAYTISVPEDLAQAQLTTENVVYRFTIPGYDPLVFRDRFEHTISIVQERAAPDPTATPSAPDQPTPDPTAAPTSTPITELGAKPGILFKTPDVAHPGQPLTYRITLQNNGTDSLNQWHIGFILPENVDYNSGGTSYDAANRRVTYPTLASIAPNGEATMVLVVDVDQNVAVGSKINAPILDSWYPVATGQYGINYPLPGQSTVYQEGTILAAYRNAQDVVFDPQIHGYSFQNYGNTKHNYGDDLGAADIFDLFGPAVCRAGSDRESCQLTATAQKWMDKEINSMNNGHCEGMAVTAQRFFEGLPFLGKSAPTDFQNDGQEVFSLGWPEQNVENYVAAYYVRQGLQGVAQERNQNLLTMTPSQVVDKLIEDFNQTPSVGYTIGFYQPGYKKGHAVTPYGIEQIPDTETYRIMVYDNNFPGEKRYMTVDKTTDSWSYISAANPSRPPDLYQGNAETKTLGLSTLSKRDKPAGEYFACTFCSQTSASVTAAQAPQAAIEIGFSGEGELLVIDDQNRSVGYDFGKEEHVNEIPGAQAKHQLNGLGLDLPAVYAVPYLESDVLYQIQVSGVKEESFTDGDLTIAGPDFVMGVEYLTLDAGENYRVDVSEDGNAVYVEATSDSVAPLLYMTFESQDETVPGTEIEVDGMLLKAGEVAYLGVDTEGKFIDFVTPDAIPVNNRDFSLYLTSFPSGEGDESAIQEEEYFFTIPKGASLAYINYSNWQEDPDSIDLVVEFSLFLPVVER